MRISRATACAVAVSTALVMGSGLVAAAAIFHLPLFGFRDPGALGSTLPSTTAGPAPTGTGSRLIGRPSPLVPTSAPRPIAAGTPSVPAGCPHPKWDGPRRSWRCEGM